MYESKIEKLLDDCTLKRYDKRARIYFALLNDLPQEELDELIDYIEYLDFNELAILHIGFATADARYKSIFDDITITPDLAGLVAKLQVSGIMDWSWLRQEFEEEFNYTFLDPKSPRYCMRIDDYDDTPSMAYQENIALPEGIKPIDELETPRKIRPKQTYLKELNDSEE